MIQFIECTKSMMLTYLPKILAIEQEAALPILWDKNNYLVDLDSKWTLSRLAMDHNSLVGCAILSKKSSSTCHLHRFMIQDKYRGKGIGSEFIQHLKLTLPRETSELTIYVGKANTHALNFYLKNGFEITSDASEDLLLSTSFKLGEDCK